VAWVTHSGLVLNTRNHVTERPSKPSKYRRAFDWRLSEGQEGRTLENYRGMVRLESSDLPEILEDFLAISRKRQNNATALSRLQIHMIEELLLQEGAVKHYRQVLSDLEKSSGSFDEGKSQEDIGFHRSELFLHRMYANAIRGIGDGVAWRALGYDRAVLRLLGERETKQHLSSEGTLQELREWSYQFATGSGIAILNALTNCLAFGDVTVVRADGSAEIVEVKASKTKSSRKIRQKQAMSEVVTLLSSGEGKNEERDVRIEILPITPETSLDKVRELLDTASESGWAARRISDCLYIEAFDLRKLKRPDDLRDLTTTVRKNAIGEWEARGDFVFDMNTLDTIEYGPNRAPFSIFPFRATTCVDLMIGAKFYVAFLNVNAVAREFEKRGWSIEKDFKALMDERSLEAFLHVRKGPFHCTVPPAEFMRMQIETLRPKTLIDAMECKFRQGPKADQGYVLAVYEGESKLWN
jgi:hypothetical protein